MCCGAKKKSINIERALTPPIKIAKSIIKPKIMVQKPVGMRGLSKVCKKCAIAMQRFVQKNDHNKLITIWKCPNCKSIEKT